MRQWNFQTDIEERNPWTGNVYYISRMTSDWAERHPLNVGDVIEGVYLEFEGTEFEESREELRRVWTAVLSVSSPQGDASLYPNRGGRRRAAAMKVWLLAGDYWRRGFRLGDTLPAMVPGCKITRIDGDGRAIERYSLADRPGTAWIALFPKELHLIENGKLEIENEPVANADTEAIVIEAVGDQASPAGDTVGTGSTCAIPDGTMVPVPDVSEVADAPALEGHTDITDNTDTASAVADDFSPVTEPTGHQAAETASPCQASDTEGTGTSVPIPDQSSPTRSLSADAGTARMEPVPVVSPAAAEVEPSPVTDGIGNQSIDIVVVTPRPTERERNAAAANSARPSATATKPASPRKPPKPKPTPVSRSAARSSRLSVQRQ